MNDNINSSDDMNNTYVENQSNCSGQYPNTKPQAKTDTDIKATLNSERKKSKREMFVGLNLINKVGVLFVVIGVIAFAQMPSEYIPNIIKTILIFALGGGMLLIGELMNRRKPDIFSHGITGGGTAVLYAAIALGSFTMETISETLTFVLCFVLTAAVYMLADRYNSQTILALSLVGGFIPVFVLTANTSYIYGAMAYFLILNSVALIMCLYRKWTAVSFVVLFLNIIANAFIIFFSFKLNGGLFNLSYTILINPIVLTAYIAISHIICAAAPIIYTARSKASFTVSDYFIVIMNVLASTTGLLILFSTTVFNNCFGILLIALTAAYTAIAAVVAHYFGSNSALSKIFGVFAIAFAFLFCISQLSFEYLPIGLTIVSFAIIITGLHLGEKFYYIFGLVIGISTVFVMFNSIGFGDKFWLSYLIYSIMLGIAVHVAIMWGYREKIAVKIFKNLALINIWIYSIYAILVKVSATAVTEGSFICDYIVPCSAIVATFIAGFIYSKLKQNFFRVFSMLLYMTAILFFFGLQLTATPAALNLSGTWYAVMLALSIVMNIVSVLVVYDLSKSFSTMTNGNGKLLPLVISGYMLISSTATFSAFDSATITNWILSVIYILMAFAWIWFGFKKNNVIMRRFGLGLALLASAKLFFIDLSTYSDVFRTVSWFAFGAVLISISYLYKLFGKRLAEKTEDETESVNTAQQ